MNFELLETHLKREIEEGRIAGSSLLIYKDEEIVFNKCFGYANIEKGYAINGNTRFRLASMTKPITAVASMIAVEQGLFNIDDYAYKYLPEIKDRCIKDFDLNVLDQGPYNFTIRQLLNHSAGFGSDKMEEVCHHIYCKDENMHDLKGFMNAAKEMHLAFIPGSKFAYSGSFAYNLVARIIEITSGLKYEDFLNKYIFKPLEMNDTSYYYNDNEEERKAVSYKSTDGKLEYFDDENKGFEIYYPGFNSGGAGLISTKGDYFNFALMLYNKGIFKGKRIIKEESFNELLKYTPTPNFISGGMETFGLSFYIRAPKYADWQKLPNNAFGWSGAYGTHFWVDLLSKMIVIYMHNSVTFGGAGAPQHVKLEDDITNIFPLLVTGCQNDEIRNRVAEMADLLKIRSILGRKPREISLGQAQRVAIARALIKKSMVYLFDEPFSNLDKPLSYELSLELRSLFSKNKATVIFISHDIEETMLLADNIIVMKEGEIVDKGSKEQILKSKNKYTLELLEEYKKQHEQD